jgi:hypothetical protein
MKRFKLEIQQVFQTFRMQSDCNAITIVNNSTSVPFYVNNILVAPGNIFQVEGNENEMDSTEYFIDMKGQQGECSIIKKMYV